jgi:calcium channel MID1
MFNNTFNASSLAQLYDQWANQSYLNFTNSLAQIPCKTTSSAQYSLARTCDDCSRDYKTWLCAVMIPRCDDFSSDAPFLQPRNMNTKFPNGTSLDQNNPTFAAINDTDRNRLYHNSSRNQLIDQVIAPGPYKELLPCQDLCFHLVQSCPAKLGFSCPSDAMMNLSYGVWTQDQLTCNYLGMVTQVSTAVKLATRLAPITTALFVGLLLMI